MPSHHHQEAIASSVGSSSRHSRVLPGPPPTAGHADPRSMSSYQPLNWFNCMIYGQAL